MSVCAYSGAPGTGCAGTAVLRLPLRLTLADGREVEVDTFRETEWETGRLLMNEEIREGRTWAFENIFEDTESYRGYFLSHAAFVIREISSSKVLGTFYVKPNFPGRCAHICNGGFIVAPKHRGIGIGRLMAACFLRFSKDLGYRSSYFNLVFASNTASVRLWESFGFKRVAEIPHAARLEGLNYLDTAYGYHYDLTTFPEGYDPVTAATRLSKL